MKELNCTPEQDYLPRVRVRLMLSEQRESFDGLLETRHYLHSARVGGQSLRYIAEVDGQWGALVVFNGGGAPHKDSALHRQSGRPMGGTAGLQRGGAAH